MSDAAVAQNQRYRPELDMLRFMAFLCVFFFHRMVYYPVDAAVHPWLFRFGVIGVFGVPVFFLLSSFLITDLLLRELQERGSIAVGAFYLRRMLRIWPLYFIALAGLVVLNRFVPGVATNDRNAWLAFSCFQGNWYIVHHGWIAAPLDPLWSISVEEQFYLAIPLIAALGGRRAVLVVAGLLFALAYAVILLYPLHREWSVKGEWPNSLVQAQFFCAGALLAIFSKRRLPGWPMIYRFSGLVAGVECWLLAMARCHIGVLDFDPTPMSAAAGWLLVLAGTVLFFLSMLGLPTGFVPGWVAYLGRISYGLYVVHSLVFFLVLGKLAPFLDRMLPRMKIPVLLSHNLWTLVCLLASVGLAQLSFRYLEGPFLRMKARLVRVAAEDRSCSNSDDQSQHESQAEAVALLVEAL